MLHDPKTNLINPAVLRFRGLDLEAATAMHLNSIRTMRRMANLMFDSVEAITQRQAEFLKNGIDRMNGAAQGKKNLSDPRSIFEQQTDAHRALFSAVTTHLSEIAEISSRCCAGLIQEATGSMVDLPLGERSKTQAGRSAGGAPKASSAKN